ncbi:MAG: hypothetical protein AABW81_01280 [Nanoarchaeota archaeon]
MKKINKLGEMSSKMLVTMVLLVAGIVILGIVFAQIGWTIQSDKEVCHQSVIMRGTLPDTLNIKDLPPLKCKTDKICVTNKMFGKGECEDSLGKDYTTMRVSSDKTKAEEEIKKILADNLAECWAMMGEGKIQVFAREGVPPKDLCVICSRIDFDKNVDLKNIKGTSEYLIKENIPNKEISYFSFLTDKKRYDESLSSKEIDVLDTSEKAIVFTEFYETKYDQMIGTGLVGLLSLKLAFVTGPQFAGAVFFAGSKAVQYISNWANGNPPDYFTSISITDYDSEDISKLGCDSLESIS